MEPPSDWEPTPLWISSKGFTFETKLDIGLNIFNGSKLKDWCLTNPAGIWGCTLSCGGIDDDDGIGRCGGDNDDDGFWGWGGELFSANKV